MKAPLAGEVTRDQVLAATDYVTPALEILDTRIVRAEGGKTRTIIDTIADNAANAGIVTGSQRHAPTADLRWVGAIVKRDGVVEETGLGAGVLDDPVTGIIYETEDSNPSGFYRFKMGQQIVGTHDFSVDTTPLLEMNQVGGGVNPRAVACLECNRLQHGAGGTLAIGACHGNDRALKFQRHPVRNLTDALQAHIDTEGVQLLAMTEPAFQCLGNGVHTQPIVAQPVHGA